MKKPLLFLIFLVISPGNLSAQEKYFHELRGMEDSTETTHLFYRMYETYTNALNCNDIVYEYSGYRNDVSHLNTENLSDSVKFQDYFDSGCFGLNEQRSVEDFSFYDNDPEKWVVFGGSSYCGGPEIVDFKGRNTRILSPCINVKASSDHVNAFKDSTPFFLLNSNQDSLYLNFFNMAFKISISDRFHPTEIEFYETEHFPDSISVSETINAIHPSIDSLFYRRGDNGSLFLSENYSSDFQLSDSSGYLSALAFDADSSVLYSIKTTQKNQEYHRVFSRSESFGRLHSWNELTIPVPYGRLQFVATDSEVSGLVYIADSTRIFKSSDFGTTISNYYQTESAIKGIYKKPNSDILYVLTLQHLLKIENAESSVLKSLPVSNEAQELIPSSITLHQNYPNPFNPSTSISYAIPHTGRVKLSVFDQLGRRVQILVDEVQSEGTHTSGFGNESLASGIYYYQLIFEDESIIKKMTLIK
jgi:hypothetical protein